MIPVARKCWVVRDADGRIVGISTQTHFRLADLDEGHTVAVGNLAEVVAEMGEDDEEAAR